MKTAWAFLVVALLVATPPQRVAAAAQSAEADAKQFRKLIDDAIELRRAHKLRESLATLDKALASARARKSVKDEIDALEFMAITYREVPDLKQVLALRLQVLDIVRANPQAFSDRFEEESTALHQLAGAYFLLNDLPNAVKYARASVDVEAPHVDQLGTVWMGRLRQFLGQLLFLTGNLAESEKVLRMAYEDFETRLRMTDRLGAPHAIAEYQFELGDLRWLERVLVAQRDTKRRCRSTSRAANGPCRQSCSCLRAPSRGRR